jgi:hypothetical protein
MMPMRLRCKVRTIEKVENFSRTATAQKIVATHEDKSDHACAIGAAMAAEFSARCKQVRKRREQACGGERADGEQDQAIETGAGGGQPAAGALPDMSHFAAEFFQMLRRPYPDAFTVPQSLGAMR